MHKFYLKELELDVFFARVIASLHSLQARVFLHQRHNYCCFIFVIVLVN